MTIACRTLVRQQIQQDLLIFNNKTVQGFLD